MIKENSQKKKELQEKDSQIRELQIYKDLHFLKDDPYYRQQKLILLERQTEAAERLAEATEKFNTHSSEDEEEESEEEEEEE